MTKTVFRTLKTLILFKKKKDEQIQKKTVHN